MIKWELFYAPTLWMACEIAMGNGTQAMTAVSSRENNNTLQAIAMGKRKKEDRKDDFECRIGKMVVIDDLS
jgi:hypothetical protein